MSRSRRDTVQCCYKGEGGGYLPQSGGSSLLALEEHRAGTRGGQEIGSQSEVRCWRTTRRSRRGVLLCLSSRSIGGVERRGESAGYKYRTARRPRGIQVQAQERPGGIQVHTEERLDQRRIQVQTRREARKSQVQVQRQRGIQVHAREGQGGIQVQRRREVSSRTETVGTSTTPAKSPPSIQSPVRRDVLARA